MSDYFVRKAASPRDQLAFQQCMAVAFLHSFDAETYKAPSPEEQAASPEEVWVSGEDRVTSGYVVHDFDVWFEGKLTKATGIGGVASLPEGRFKGGIRSIFEKQLPDSYERGYVFSMLFPFSHIFYRKFGYELVQPTRTYVLPMQDLKIFSCQEPVTLISDPAEIDAIHRAFGSQHTLTIARRACQYHFVSKDPVQAVNYTYKIGDSAFVTFRPQRSGDEDYLLKVRDVAYRDAEAFRSLLGFFYTLRAQFNKVEIELPDSVPMMYLLTECYDGGYETSAHGMARIVNAEKALSLMHYEGSGRFTLAVTDEQIPQNNATFTVTYRDGIPAVTREAAPVSAPDLTVTIQRLTQLVLGTLTVPEALWLDGCTCPDPTLFTHVFLRKNCFFNDPF